MTKELKETIRMIFHQIENVNREKLQKRNQIGILELKTTITKMRSY